RADVSNSQVPLYESGCRGRRYRLDACQRPARHKIWPDHSQASSRRGATVLECSRWGNEPRWSPTGTSVFCRHVHEDASVILAPFTSQARIDRMESGADG